MLLGLFIMFSIILIIPFSFDLKYHRKFSSGNIRLIVWIWKIPIMIPLQPLKRIGAYFIHKISISPDEKQSVSQMRWMKAIVYLLRLTKNSSRMFIEEISKLEFKVEYSCQDAALLGISFGIIWWVLTIVFRTIYQSYHCRSLPQLKVQPVFVQKQFDLYFHCIFRIRLGHIIGESVKSRLK